jgi:hypothetical protein
MSRRIEIELTSTRPEGSWTWRAAGAREPRGVLEGTLLPGGAKVGDILRAEADFQIDGIEILEVLPPKGSRKEPERIEVIGAGTAFEPVTQTLAPKSDRPDRPRRDRPDGDRPRRDRPEGDRRPRTDGRPADARPSGPRSDRPDSRGPRPTDRPDSRGPRPTDRRDGPPRPDGQPARAEGGPRTERPRRERPPRPPVPELPSRPKPKRLRPGRTHRNELLASLRDEEKPVAEQLMKGGMSAVREGLKEQNDKAVAAGQAPVPAAGILGLADQLLPRVRVAEWLDEATAAQSMLDELDLRDLRAVVTRSDDPMVTRVEHARELASSLREGLATRQEKEHTEWLADIEAALTVGRAVRALRLSSRPPKAGVRFPTELGTRLSEAASASLTADATSERWVAVLEAVAYSPVHAGVTAQSVPAPVPDEVTSMTKRLAGLVPGIAKQLGIDPPPPGSRSPRPPRPTRKTTGSKSPAGGRSPAAKPVAAPTTAEPSLTVDPAPALPTADPSPVAAADPSPALPTAEAPITQDTPESAAAQTPADTERPADTDIDQVTVATDLSPTVETAETAETAEPTDTVDIAEPGDIAEPAESHEVHDAEA